MRNISAITCVMLTFSVGVHAMDSGMPDALSPESVPPTLQSRQTVPLATPREGALAPSVGESEEPRARPVIVVRLQNAEPIMRQADETMAALQSDIEWGNRRLNRLARFMELAARNAKFVGVGSTGDCNTNGQFIRWRVKLQGLPRTLIQT